MANDDSGSGGARAEAARIRRRWINVGELLAVAAVLISALTFWNSWRERTHAEAKDAREEQRQDAAAAAIVLGATADAKGRLLTIAPLHAEQRIQEQTIVFPPALGIAPVETTGDARIEAEWFEKALKRARHDAGATAETVGDLRLPVLVTTRYLADDAQRTARACYDIGYRIPRGGLFGGSDVRMTGLSLVANGAASSARLDALWRARGGAKG